MGQDQIPHDDHLFSPDRHLVFLLTLVVIGLSLRSSSSVLHMSCWMQGTEQTS